MLKLSKEGDERGIRSILHSVPQIIGKLLSYETYAMKLKKKYTENVDWYLYNLSVSSKAQDPGIDRMISYNRTVTDPSL